MAWLNRKRVLAPLLLAAAGGPFLATEDGWKPTWLSNISLPSVASLTGGSPTASLPGEYGFRPSTTNITTPHDFGGFANAAAPSAQVQSARQLGFADYIRFDLAPNQIFDTWDRVTTVLSDTNLEGLRVVLVTGSRVDDIAGSLTYYFDQQHQTQRITFQGTTGDPTRLIQFAKDTYQMQQQPTLDAALYVAQWNGQPTSALRVFNAPVVRADQTHTRYDVQLEINRPYVPYNFKLTPPHEQQLRNGHNVNRW